MALHPVNQPIRWLRRIGIFLTEVLASFFDIRRSDNVLTSSGKVAAKTSSRVLYKVLDYWTIVAGAAIVAHMKKEGFDFWSTTGALWLFDMVMAAAFVLWHEATGHDITLGKDFRRATDRIHSASPIAGYISMVGVVLFAVFWSGPEQVILFFRKEIRSFFRGVVILLVLTAIQSYIWTIIYGLGYDLAISWL